MRRSSLLVLYFAAGLAWAQTSEKLDPVPEPPPIPKEMTPEEAAIPSEFEPEIIIRTEEDQVIEEHRVRGRVYMIKITPKVGPPYYLLDRDGDGEMETRVSDLDNDVEVPKWVLMRW